VAFEDKYLNTVVGPSCVSTSAPPASTPAMALRGASASRCCATSWIPERHSPVQRALGRRLPVSRQARKEGGSILDGNAGSGLRGTQQESFKKQLAAGEVVWPTWWEVADAVNHMNYFGRVMSPEKMKD
jgi:hypothetical protein